MRGGGRADKGGMIHYPALDAFLYAVEMLRRLYPGDRIPVVSKDVLEDAVSAAEFAAAYTRDTCRKKRLVAAATLFYEIITRHPLSDGNKRLGATMLAAFMKKNSLKTPQPGRVWRIAIHVATGEWSPEEIIEWLEEVQEKPKH